MMTFIAASIAAAATAPATQPAAPSPHAQHGQQPHGTGQPNQQHQMGKMEGCCCCKDMAAKMHSGDAPPLKAGKHSGH